MNFRKSKFLFDLKNPLVRRLCKIEHSRQCWHAFSTRWGRRAAAGQTGSIWRRGCRKMSRTTRSRQCSRVVRATGTTFECRLLKMCSPDTAARCGASSFCCIWISWIKNEIQTTRKMKKNSIRYIYRVDHIFCFVKKLFLFASWNAADIHFSV